MHSFQNLTVHLTTLISSTYIGGTDSDKATGIALDNNGRQDVTYL